MANSDPNFKALRVCPPSEICENGVSRGSVVPAAPLLSGPGALWPVAMCLVTQDRTFTPVMAPTSERGGVKGTYGATPRFPLRTLMPPDSMSSRRTWTGRTCAARHFGTACENNVSVDEACKSRCSCPSCGHGVRPELIDSVGEVEVVQLPFMRAWCATMRNVGLWLTLTRCSCPSCGHGDSVPGRGVRAPILGEVRS